MGIKTMLRKVFERYAVLGANSASARGCYEMPIPAYFSKKVESGTTASSKTIRK